MFDHQIVHPYPLTIGQDVERAIPRLAGDSIDCVRNLVHLPRGIQVGDWLGWGEMGAYTMCAASSFNGMPIAPSHFTTGGQSDDSREVRRILDSFVAY
jgi:ornithine decarboxylase